MNDFIVKGVSETGVKFVELVTGICSEVERQMRDKYNAIVMSVILL